MTKVVTINEKIEALLDAQKILEGIKLKNKAILDEISRAEKVISDYRTELKGYKNGQGFETEHYTVAFKSVFVKAFDRITVAVSKK